MGKSPECEDAHEPLWTLQETVAYLQISESAMYRNLKKGKIPGLRIAGGLWRFKKSDLDAWMAEKDVTNGQRSL